MAENFGLNFSPMAGSGQKPMQRPTGGGGVQDAIRTLSLKIPKVSGAQGIAPNPLMQSPGGPSAPMGTAQQPGFNGDFLQALLSMLGLSPGAGMNDSGLAGAAPVPRVIPGIGGDQAGAGGLSMAPPPSGGPSVSIPGGVNWVDILRRGGITGNAGGAQPGQGPFNNPNTQAAMNDGLKQL